MWCVVPRIGFNSILVRLKEVEARVARLSDLFQFHSGTVKSLTQEGGAGSIGDGFNSILVRLKGTVRLIVALIALFQFHSGTVKRSKFNKKNGYIKPVSIPFWYG